MLRALLLIMTLWYVDGLHGSDANSGTSAGAAFQTLAKAAASMAAGDTVNVCATATYTLTASVTWPSGSTPSTITGANASGVVDGTTAAIATAINAVSPFAMSAGSPGAGFNLAYLAASSTATSPGPAVAIGSGFCSITANHCSFRGFSTLATGTSSSDAKSLYDCEIGGCTGVGLNISSNATTLDSCAIHNNAGGGAAIFSSGPTSLRDCEIYANGGHGLNFTGDYSAQNTLIGCTLANNSGDGYRDANANRARPLFVVNCVFYGNSGYGFNTGATPSVILNATNAYGSNTSGARNNLPASLTDIALTANPFTSSTNLTPNTTAGGGALIRAAAYPGSFLDGVTSYRDIGAVQHQDAGSAPTPPRPNLTVTDKGDGTGATASIAGSAAGSTNTVYTVSKATTGAQAWTNAGSLTGDGTVGLSLANGSYEAICVSSLGALNSTPSNPYSFGVTGGGASYNCPHAAVAHSVQSTILGLLGTRITGVVADSVRVRKVPYGVDFSSAMPLAAGLHAYPAILAVYGDKERDLAGVCDRDDIGYPVTVVFAAKDVTAQGTSDVEGNDDMYLSWRQAVSDVFRNEPYTITNYARLNPVTFQTCQLEYGPTVDWGRWQKDQIFVGAMTLVFVLRKFRGVNPLN